MSEVPTLLVGLGGIGSRIVDSVYGMIPRERRSAVAVHAFDTNVNDISKLTHLTGDRLTQTSTDLTVGQYLDRVRGTGDSVDHWFPSNQLELRRKQLTEGAGQIRVVSRLAYRAAIQEGRLNGLEQQIAQIFRATGSDFITSVRVMIVSSVVGGTGAGLFLQTALYIRELLQRRFRRENVIVRGAFILPDVLIQTRLLNETQWSAVRANGYACLKELDAITRNASSASDGRITIDLEYRPGQTDAYGHPSTAITARQLPYDFAFLFDYENSRNQNLQTFDNYIRQIRDTVFLQLFTPLSAPHASIEDNEILSLISHEGLNRYCGAGVARLVFPRQDIVEYCALRWATDSLSEQWLKLDMDFEDAFRTYEQDINSGLIRDAPEIDDLYVNFLDQLASGTSARPFFRQVHRSAHLVDERGNIEKAKSLAFLDALDVKIKSTLAEDKELQQVASTCELDETLVQNRDNAEAEIARMEDALLAYAHRVENAVHEYGRFIFNQALLQDAENPAGGDGEPFRLNTWLLMKEAPLHPVGIRYVLYQLRREIESRHSRLVTENERRKEGIDRYASTYDDEETLDLVEDATDRIRAALGQPIFKRILDNHFKEFVDEYQEKSAHQKSTLAQYVDAKLRELVYEQLLKALKEILRGWEGYFHSLRHVKSNLQRELNQMAVAHEEANDPTTRFVLADAEVKKALWDRIRMQVARAEIPVEVSQQIYLGQYRSFVEAFRAQNSLRPPERRSTEKSFREDVVSWCRSEAEGAESLQLNVIQALRMEAGLMHPDEDPEDYVADAIRALDNLALPFVPNLPNASPMTFWAMHPDCQSQLSQEAIDSLFGDGTKSADSAFSPEELIRYRAAYGLRSEDFPKFSAGNPSSGTIGGNYFLAYNERRDQLIRGESTVTPHLDRRWHLAAYMPDLNQRVQLEDMEKVRRAFLLGLIYESFKQYQAGAEPPVWEHHSPTSFSLVYVGGEPVPAKLHRLNESLPHNPAIVDSVLEIAAAGFERGRDQYPKVEDIREHAFWQGCLKPSGTGGTNILEAILRYASNHPSDDQMERTGQELLTALVREILCYVRRLTPPSQRNTVLVTAQDLIASLESEAPVIQSAEPQYLARYRTVMNGLLTLEAVDKACS